MRIRIARLSGGDTKEAGRNPLLLGDFSIRCRVQLDWKGLGFQPSRKRHHKIAASAAEGDAPKDTSKSLLCNILRVNPSLPIFCRQPHQVAQAKLLQFRILRARSKKRKSSGCGHKSFISKILPAKALNSLFCADAIQHDRYNPLSLKILRKLIKKSRSAASPPFNGTMNPQNQLAIPSLARPRYDFPRIRRGALMLISFLRCFADRFLRTVAVRTLLISSLLIAPTAFAQTWNLTWSDEFNGSANRAISAQNWQYDTGILNVNNEVEYYCAPGSSTAPCNLANPNAYIDGNGHLVIQALRINSSVAPYSGSWSSARLKSQTLQTFQYGRIESSISLPLGPGIWPAFWALGTNITSVGWPACGEMDFMEDVPLSSGLGPNTISSTMHGGNSSSNCYCGSNGMGKKFTFPANDPNGTDVTTFHTYGAIWSPSMVQFYVDDPTKVFFVRTVNDLPSGFTWDFNHSFFLLLNLAIGGTGSWPGPPDGSTPSPAIMRVDYVRAYTSSPVTAPSMTAPPINVTAGQTGSSTVALNSTTGAGRVYLACSTNAPKATCSIQSSDPLNPYTLDFSTASSGTANASVTTTANTSAKTNLPLGFVGLGIGLVGLAFASRKPRRTPPMFVASLLLWLCWGPGCGGSAGSSGMAGGSGGNSNGTAPGSYTVTVNAYTVSGNGNAPDSSLSIPLTVK